VSTELRVDRAWVEVDLANLVENARAVRHAAHDAPLLPMVKADGYGLGAVPVVRALETIEPWGFGVATVSEGVELRRAGVTRPVVVFTPARIDDLSRLGENELTAVLDDPAVIDEGGTGQPYHCEVDTGMSRAGIRWNDAVGLRALARNPPQGVFTHLHSADTSEDMVNLQPGTSALRRVTMRSKRNESRSTTGPVADVVMGTMSPKRRKRSKTRLSSPPPVATCIRKAA